jgi:chemotaxis regulatin CheY-phosphate phosphatase CheZ
MGQPAAAPSPAPAGESLSREFAGIARQAEGLAQSMQDFFQKLDRTIYRDLSAIADAIAKAREEIRALQPHSLCRERLPSAGAELRAIVKDTEAATHRIMTAAEALLASSPEDTMEYRAFRDEQVTLIFEACGFQDITGQRVSKVVGVLEMVESRVGRLAGALGVSDAERNAMEPEDSKRRDKLLNGPAINGPETSQDEIDAMFDGQSSQAEIDSLFS